MKLKIVAVRDKIADAYMPPSFVHNIGQVVREFGDTVNNKEHAFNKHPSHYDLYLLGEWDDYTGDFTPEDPPRQLAIGEEQPNKQ